MYVCVYIYIYINHSTDNNANNNAITTTTTTTTTTSNNNNDDNSNNTNNNEPQTRVLEVAAEIRRHGQLLKIRVNNNSIIIPIGTNNTVMITL